MNNLIEIQKIVDKQIKRLDDEELMKKSHEKEVVRSKALSTSVMTYIKVIDTQLKVKEYAKAVKKTEDAINKEFGISE